MCTECGGWWSPCHFFPPLCHAWSLWALLFRHSQNTASGLQSPTGPSKSRTFYLSDSILVSFLTASWALRTSVPLSHWLFLAFHITESMSFFLGLTFHLMSKPPDSPTLQPMARVLSSLPNKVPPHICVYTHMYIFTIIYICICIYTYTCTYVCLYVHIHVCIYLICSSCWPKFFWWIPKWTLYLSCCEIRQQNTGKHVFL